MSENCVSTDRRSNVKDDVQRTGYYCEINTISVIIDPLFLSSVILPGLVSQS